MRTVIDKKHLSILKYIRVLNQIKILTKLGKQNDRAFPPSLHPSDSEENLTTLAGRSSKDGFIAGFAVFGRCGEREEVENFELAAAAERGEWTRILSTHSNNLGGQIAWRIQFLAMLSTHESDRPKIQTFCCF